MRKKIVIISSLCVLVCLSIIITVYALNKKPSMTAEQLVTKLQEGNLPINNIIIYDEQTDKNKLLGRPNQYVSKVNFADSRIEQFEGLGPNGGSIETFKNTSDLNARKEYIESVMEKSPTFTEYMVVNGNYLLRLSKDLTNDQVAEYKEVFMNIK